MENGPHLLVVVAVSLDIFFTFYYSFLCCQGDGMGGGQWCKVGSGPQSSSFDISCSLLTTFLSFLICIFLILCCQGGGGGNGVR